MDPMGIGNHHFQVLMLWVSGRYLWRKPVNHDSAWPSGGYGLEVRQAAWMCHIPKRWHWSRNYDLVLRKNSNVDPWNICQVPSEIWPEVSLTKCLIKPLFLRGRGQNQKYGRIYFIPWEPKTFIFRGYNPYIGGLKPSFFMGFWGSKGKQLQLPRPLHRGQPTLPPGSASACGEWSRQVVGSWGHLRWDEFIPWLRWDFSLHENPQKN